MAEPRKNNTSRAARDKWDKEHLQKYMISLRTDTDADLIASIEYLKSQGYRTSEAFKELLRAGLSNIK